MKLYMQNREYGRMILELVKHSPLIWPTIEENGVTRTKKSAAEKIQADCDMKATNIIIQGLPSDIYSLVNYHRLPRIYGREFNYLCKVNTKFLNSLPPEWSKFVTDVKLVKDLHTTNFDQLHAYLQQHELRANEVRLPREHNQDPLAFMANQQMHHLTSTLITMAFLIVVASSRCPSTNNQLRTSLNPRNQATIQDGRVTVQQARVVKCYNFQGEEHMARQCTQPKRPRNATWYKDKVMLAEAQEAGQILDEEELALLADLGVQIQGGSHGQHFQYGSDVILEVPHSETYLNDMENQKKANKEQNNESVTAELERYKEQVKNFEQRFYIDLSSREKMIDSQMDDMIKEKITLKEQVDSLEQNLSNKPSDALPVKIEAPKELPKISSANESLKKLKFHLAKFDNVVKIRTTPNARTEGMFKLDLEPLVPRLLQNKEIHIEYLKYTQEHADILRGIVDQAKAKQPLDNALDFACKHAQRIQELLVYVRDTCLNTINLNAKKIAVTPKNKVKKVSRAKYAKKHKKQNIWKPTGHVFTEVGFKWKLTSRTFTIVGNSYRLTMITSANVVPPKKPTSHSAEPQKLELKVYSRKPKNIKNVGSSKKAKVVQIILWYLDSGCSKHMTGNRSQLMNFVSKFLGTVRFENDHIARIIGYGDYQLGNVTISRVYYVEGLGHNFFSVGQFCDTDLEVAFRENTCFIRNLEGLVPNNVSQEPCNPPNKDDLDHLFQPMFDEYFNPVTVAVSPVPVVVAPRAVDLADSLVSTSIDQDAPSTSIPSTQEQEHSPNISQGSSSNVLRIHTPFEYLGRWTKDHPIANMIGDPSRSVSTRKQLKTDAMWCYFDAFLTYVEPKNFKQAMTEPSWINAIVKINPIPHRDGIILGDEMMDDDFGESWVNILLKEVPQNLGYGVRDRSKESHGILQYSKAYKTYLDYATGKVPPKKARKFKKHASPKLKTFPRSPKEPTQKVSKKKVPTKTDSGNGIELLSDVALLEDAQLKETLRKIKQETHNLQASGSSEELILNQSNDDSWGDSEDESNDVHDEDDNDDDEDNDDDSGNDDDGDYEEEEQYEEYVLTPERNKSNDEYKMYEEEDDDVAKDLSSILSDFTSKLLNLDDPYPDINSLMNTSTVPPPPPPVYPSLHPTIVPQQQTPDSTITTTYPIMTLPISAIAKECYKQRLPPRTFDELMGTPVDFSANVMNHLKIDNLTQDLVVPTFNLLKCTCKSFSELEYHFEECYKSVNDRLDWHNPERCEYPFYLSKPLPLIEDRGRQVVPADYFINNELEYLKGGSSSSKYATSTTRTKAAKYDNIEGTKDMVPTLWSLVKVAYNKHRIIAVTSVKVMRWYNYGYLEEIVVRRNDDVLYKFKEGNFPRLNLCDIEDMLLLLVQKKLFNLDVDDRYDLSVALRMFTRSIVIVHLVEDLLQGVESYQIKLNSTRPETFKSDISNMIPYTTYKNP
uniref:Integrase, catalytic region, zinc finger, CCHC-type, peptidase aspartic, catalytic n=1 Tax=Tanacetum cinerariifolium TaxID=118510 RepID=A0A6L2JUQ6_TANCI|nr:integrase, catalytic region, zinc finger, CCHC-type, peptidase aspartic, catalytic [Tanacetum cinerariifolium]